MAKSNTEAEKVDTTPVDTTPVVFFLHPFAIGVTYPDFLAAIPEGVTVAEYCEGHLTAEELAWIESEIKNYNNNLK